MHLLPNRLGLTYSVHYMTGLRTTARGRVSKYMDAHALPPSPRPRASSRLISSWTRLDYVAGLSSRDAAVSHMPIPHPVQEAPTDNSMRPE